MHVVMYPVRTGRSPKTRVAWGQGRGGKNRKSDMKSVIFISLKKKSLLSVMFLYMTVFKIFIGLINHLISSKIAQVLSLH